jgi:hypothetical protein
VRGNHTERRAERQARPCCTNRRPSRAATASSTTTSVSGCSKWRRRWAIPVAVAVAVSVTFPVSVTISVSVSLAITLGRGGQWGSGRAAAATVSSNVAIAIKRGSSKIAARRWRSATATPPVVEIAARGKTIGQGCTARTATAATTAAHHHARWSGWSRRSRALTVAHGELPVAQVALPIAFSFAFALRQGRGHHGRWRATAEITTVALTVTQRHRRHVAWMVHHTASCVARMVAQRRRQVVALAWVALTVPLPVAAAAHVSAVTLPRRAERWWRWCMRVRVRMRCMMRVMRGREGRSWRRPMVGRRTTAGTAAGEGGHAHAERHRGETCTAMRSTSSIQTNQSKDKCIVSC